MCSVVALMFRFLFIYHTFCVYRFSILARNPNIYNSHSGSTYGKISPKYMCANHLSVYVGDTVQVFIRFIRTYHMINVIQVVPNRINVDSWYQQWHTPTTVFALSIAEWIHINESCCRFRCIKIQHRMRPQR